MNINIHILITYLSSNIFTSYPLFSTLLLVAGIQAKSINGIAKIHFNGIAKIHSYIKVTIIVQNSHQSR